MGFEDLITKADLAAAVAKFVAMVQVATAPKKEPYLTLKQAAEYIKDKPCTLGEKVRAGEIPHIRDGRLIKFATKDLDAYMMARRVMSNAEVQSLASVKGSK